MLFLSAVPLKVQAADTVIDGVYIENTDVSGMTREELKQTMTQQIEEMKTQQADLYVGENKVTVTLEELGISCDTTRAEEQAFLAGSTGNVLQRYRMKEQAGKNPIVIELSFQVDEEKVRQIIETQCVPLNQDVVHTGLKKTQSGFEVTDGKDGITVQTEQSVAHVTEYFAQNYHGGRAGIMMQGEITEAKGSEEELAKVQDLLGQSSTEFKSSSANRRKNIGTGAEKINGVVIYPGDEFSMIDLVTPFNKENGYETAPSYAGGSVVDTYGGGICQVSTTLYLAVLRAELEVTERHNHSMAVEYVKRSMDAAIAEEAGKDFRFVNNTDAPIYIEAYTYRGTLGVNIYGQENRDPNRKVTYESKVLTTTEPDTKLTADPNKPAGTLERTSSPHTGYTAELWKVVTVNGEEQSREKVNSSSYRMSPASYTVGTQTDNADLLQKLQNAIAANDLNTVRVLIGK